MTAVCVWTKRRKLRAAKKSDEKITAQAYFCLYFLPITIKFKMKNYNVIGIEISSWQLWQRNCLQQYKKQKKFDSNVWKQALIYVNLQSSLPAIKQPILLVPLPSPLHPLCFTCPMFAPFRLAFLSYFIFLPSSPLPLPKDRKKWLRGLKHLSSNLISPCPSHRPASICYFPPCLLAVPKQKIHWNNDANGTKFSENLNWLRWKRVFVNVYSFNDGVEQSKHLADSQRQRI